MRLIGRMQTLNIRTYWDNHWTPSKQTFWIVTQFDFQTSTRRSFYDTLLLISVDGKHVQRGCDLKSFLLCFISQDFMTGF